MKCLICLFFVFALILPSKINAKDEINSGLLHKLRSEGKWEELFKITKKTIKYDQDNLDDYLSGFVWHDFYLSSKKTNQQDKAKQLFIEQTQKKPNNYDAWYYLGQYYAENEEWENVIIAFQNAIKINPDHGAYRGNYFLMNPWNHIFNAYRETNQLDEAKKFFIEQTQINPNNDDAWYYLSNTYGFLEEWDKGINASKQVLRIEPDHTYALLDLGFYYCKKEKWQLAINPLTKGLQNFPENSSLWVFLGIAYYEVGQKNMAKKTFQTALRHDPDNYRAKLLLRALENE